MIWLVYLQSPAYILYVYLYLSIIVDALKVFSIHSFFLIVIS